MNRSVRSHSYLPTEADEPVFRAHSYLSTEADKLVCPISYTLCQSELIYTYQQKLMNLSVRTDIYLPTEADEPVCPVITHLPTKADKMSVAWSHT